MSDLLPLFPLPATVLFPSVFLPLHIFEPRYREMIADAVAGERLIGMVLLRPGWEQPYEGGPPVYAVGCSGVISHVDRLADGRYNIVLRGLDRFRIEAEGRERRYRRARVATLREAPVSGNERARLRSVRHRLESMIVPAAERTGTDARTATGMSDEDLVNALAQYLELDPIEKQALLEMDGVVPRGTALVELLEMKRLMARTPGAPHLAH